MRVQIPTFKGQEKDDAVVSGGEKEWLETPRENCDSVKSQNPWKEHFKLTGAQTFQGDKRDKDGKPPNGMAKRQKGHW